MVPVGMSCSFWLWKLAVNTHSFFEQMLSIPCGSVDVNDYMIV